MKYGICVAIPCVAVVLGFVGLMWLGGAPIEAGAAAPSSGHVQEAPDNEPPATVPMLGRTIV